MLIGTLDFSFPVSDCESVYKVCLDDDTSRLVD